jgi:hypothetical protein
VKAKLNFNGNEIKFNLYYNSYDNIMTFLDRHELLFLADKEININVVGSGYPKTLRQYLEKNTNSYNYIVEFLNKFNLRYYDNNIKIDYDILKSDNWTDTKIIIIPNINIQEKISLDSTNWRTFSGQSFGEPIPPGEYLFLKFIANSEFQFGQTVNQQEIIQQTLPSTQYVQNGNNFYMIIPPEFDFQPLFPHIEMYGNIINETKLNFNIGFYIPILLFITQDAHSNIINTTWYNKNDVDRLSGTTGAGYITFTSSTECEISTMDELGSFIPMNGTYTYTNNIVRFNFPEIIMEEGDVKVTIKVLGKIDGDNLVLYYGFEITLILDRYYPAIS